MAFGGISKSIVLGLLFVAFWMEFGEASQVPLVAILTSPISGGLHQAFPQYRSKINPEYSDWLAASGIQSVPIVYTQPWSEIKKVLDQVHGVVFQGGDSDWLEEGRQYLEAGRQIWKYALEQNDQGRKFALWMTCLGFEESLVLATNDTKIFLDNFDAENLMLPLDFSHDYSSRMFSLASQDVLQYFATLPITVNMHHNGISVDHFQANQKLTSFFNVISTNKDRQGSSFVSAIEAKQYPIYAVQFHPERNQYIFDHTANDHSMEAMLGVQYLANFYSQQLRSMSKPPLELEQERLLRRKPTQYAPVRGWNKSLFFF